MKQNFLKTSAYIAFVVCTLALATWVPTLFSDPIDAAQLDRVRSSRSPKASIEAKAVRDDYYFWMLRDPEINMIPPTARLMEMEHATLTAVYKTSADPQIDWEARGPFNIGGRTRALAVDMRNASIILAGGVSGGMWKSTDGGNSWSLRNTAEQNLSITWVVQDPRVGHQNTWYYSGGEYRGGSAVDRGGRAFLYGTGIYKSTDNGDSWQVIPSTVIRNPTIFDSPFDFVSRLSISPVTGTIFMASNVFGIYRSTDGGATFLDGTNITSGLVLGNVNEHTYNDVIVLSNGTVVASLSADRDIDTEPFAGIYKSVLDGAPGTWENITPNGFPPSHLRSVMTHSESEPNLVYIITQELLDGSNYRMTLFRFNVVTGESENLTALVPNFGPPAGNFDPQNGYNLTIAVKPDDPNFVMLGGTNLYRSVDRFETPLNNKDLNWIGGYSNNNSFSKYPVHHPDQHVMFFDPVNPNRMWSGHDGGVSVTEDITAPIISWVDRNRGYTTTQFYTVAIPDNADDDRILGGTQDNGSLNFRGFGDAVDVTSGDGSYAFFGDNFAYASTQVGDTYRLRYDSNGGILRNSRTSIQPSNATGQMFIHPFELDPIDQNVMYYPERNNLWRNTKISTAAGDQTGFNGTQDGWTRLTLGISSNLTISTLEVSRNPEHILYIGASQRTSGGTAILPMVYRMDNSRSATEVTPIPLPSGGGSDAVTPGSYIHDIAVNPANADEILVIISNYNVNSIFHSIDGGQSYRVVDGNLGNVGTLLGPSIRTAQLLPIEGGTFAIVGTSTGVYSTETLNGGNTVWAREGLNEIGTVVVQKLDARTSDGLVAAGTHGRGIFSGTLKLPIVEVSVPDIFALHPNYPNPFNPETTIAFDIPKTSLVNLRVYDILGREVRTLLNNQELRARTHRIRFDAGQLASGTYLYRLDVREIESGAQVRKTGKMMLIR